jgi:hypothetical protein
MQFFKSDEYGSGYEYCSCGYPTDIVEDMVLLLPGEYGLSAICCGLLSDFSIRIIQFSYLKSAQILD